MNTILKLLTIKINKDCAIIILSFLQKIYYKRMIDSLLNIKPYIKLKNYILQTNLYSIAPANLESRSQINQTLYYLGSPYHFSDIFYQKKRMRHFFKRTSKPTVKLVNFEFNYIRIYNDYYEIYSDPISRKIKGCKLPIYNFKNCEYNFSLPSCYTVFTEIINSKKWWEIQFDGYIYRFIKRNWWGLDPISNEIFRSYSDVHGMSSFKFWINRKLPTENDFIFYLKKICNQNNIENNFCNNIEQLFFKLMKI